MSGQSAISLSASQRFAAHAASLDWVALSPAALEAIQAFTLDTLGVGIAGRVQPYAQAFARVFGRTSGPASQWGGGRRSLGPAEAAAINAFQAHCQEFDCVHEAAVLHPFTVVVPALLALAQAQPMTAQRYIAACAAGVDVAVGLGVAARSQIKFFRPAVCGLFGATAALSRARGFSATETAHALGYALSFAAGTMQAHVEGTPALAASVGHAARAAFDAVDLVEQGLPGPIGAFDGPFGYFRLFETETDPEPVLEALGRVWRVAEVSYKPFPTGRAAHGGIDMALQLRAQGLTGEKVHGLTIFAPPLIHHLVGRPVRIPLEVNYARLCLPYCAAFALRHGRVDLEAFTPEALVDASTLALAERITVIKVENDDAAAFTPQRAVAQMRDGRTLEARVEALLGSPARPLSEEQARAKFMACAAFGGLGQAAAQDVVEAVGALHELTNVALLAELASGD